MSSSGGAVPGRWTAERVQEWYARQPWLVGANFIPSDAVNQLEMWQVDSFNPGVIDKELALAESLGMNTMRVFLHDLAWHQDAKGFLGRIDTYLDIASRRGIRTMLVLFDSVWRPDSNLGKQPAPVPGVHNSQWLQNPGNAALSDPAQEPRLQAYVEGVVGAFADDDRVVVWDVWNEPSNLNAGRFSELPNKHDLVAGLMNKVFAWARNAKPSQPLTAGLWMGERFEDDPLYAIQVANSDVYSFHSYDPPEQLLLRVAEFDGTRPLLLTEYMARTRGSTFEAIMPVARDRKIGIYNWGFVAGKTQTNLPWDSWQKPYVDQEPPLWFHDIFHADGRPYIEDEVRFIRGIMGK
jgi:hypothetical protein